MVEAMDFRQMAQLYHGALSWNLNGSGCQSYFSR